MNVKVLGINGSPHKDGKCSFLLNFALAAARISGSETKSINLYDFNLSPCIGCVSKDPLSCRYPCVLKDDGKKIYDLILSSDGIILATPIYWFDVPGVVKNLIDRLTALENMIAIDGKSWLEGKVVGIIAVGNDSGAIHLISTLLTTLNDMGFAIPPWSFAYTHDSSDILEQKKVLNDVANVGRNVTLLAKAMKEKVDWYSKELSKEVLALSDVLAIAHKNR